MNKASLAIRQRWETDSVTMVYALVVDIVVLGLLVAAYIASKHHVDSAGFICFAVIGFFGALVLWNVDQKKEPPAL